MCIRDRVFPVNLKDAPSVGGAGIVAMDQVTRVPGMPTLPMDDAAAAVLQIATQLQPSGSRILLTTPNGWR